MADTSPKDEGLSSKPWLMALMLAVLVVLGISVWWITTHQTTLYRWLNKDDAPKVQKPTVQPTAP